MPAIGFVCPDGAQIKFEDCLNGCRIADQFPTRRCKATPYLRRLAHVRVWNGHPSTTQLLKGTREAWLDITRDYYFDPDSRAYAFSGTFGHGILEKFASGEDEKFEERLRDDICSGKFDFYSGDEGILYDYKMWGGYKLQQALGIKEDYKWIPRRNKQGVIMFKYVDGEKKVAYWDKEPVLTMGHEVTRIFGLLDTAIQLSDYRDKLKKILPEGYEVKQLAVQAICRESSKKALKTRGIPSAAPVIIVNGISSHWVSRYMQRKRDLLLKAIEDDYSPPCRRADRWYPNEKKDASFAQRIKCMKCSSYCSLFEFCKEIGEREE